MNQGPDESITPGECPLCLSCLPIPADPRAVTDVVAVLSRHFSHACAAIATPGPRPEIQVVHR